jgi:flagellar motor switch protein FliM
VPDTSEPGAQEEPTQADRPDARPDAGERSYWYHSSGRPHAMRWLADDFAGSLAAVGSGLLHADLQVRLAGAVQSSRSHFAQTLEELTCSYVLSSRPPEAGKAGPAVCLEFSPALAFAMIECLLGASGVAPAVPDRPLTAAERRVLHRVVEAAAASLSAAWPGVPKRRFHAELKPVPSAAAAAEEPVVVITFELAFHGRVGSMRLCAAGGLMDALVLGDFRHRPETAPLELSAALEGITLDEADLAQLAEGDIVATEIPADGEVIVRIGGIPKFAARLGTAGGRKLLTITRRLDEPAGSS